MIRMICTYCKKEMKKDETFKHSRTLNANGTENLAICEGEHMTKFIDRKNYQRARIQFDAIGLTEDKGWTEEKIFEFIQQPNWYNKYSWSLAQSDACYKLMMKKKLLRKNEVPFYDANIGWKDE